MIIDSIVITLLRSLMRRRMQSWSNAVLFLERNYQPYKNEAPLGRNDIDYDDYSIAPAELNH